MLDDTVDFRLRLKEKSLYLHHTRGKRLLRFIAYDEVRDRLLFKPVALKWSKDPTAVVEMAREAALRLFDEGKLVEHREVLIKHFMTELDDKKLLRGFKGSRQGVDPLENKAWLKKRDDDYGLIEELVASEVIARTFSPKTQSVFLRAHTGGDAAKTKHLKRLLHRYAWFGLTKNALLNLESEKGRMGVLVRHFKAKPGRPNALVRFAPELKEEYGGTVVGEEDLAKFLLALEEFYIKKDYSLKRTYDEMVTHHYRQMTRSR